MSSSFPAASAVMSSINNLSCFCTSAGASLACFLRIGNRNRLASDMDLVLLLLGDIGVADEDETGRWREGAEDRRELGGEAEAGEVE